MANKKFTTTKNANLNKAKGTKNDEFYTLRSDIENELSHYANHFKDKVVYCNCDDPIESEFWQFFKRNFKAWRLKKLIATHYEPDEKNYSYVLEICEDTNGDGKVNNLDKPTITQIPCNGDFRSSVCIEYLKEADIVVTNPPFSLFREYVEQLLEYEKSFLIIGTQNALTYKEFFKYLQNNKLWVGYTYPKKFRVPNNCEGKSIIAENGIKYQKFGNVCWYTNLDISKRHQWMDLRGNYYTPDDYPKYDNYDAIEVSKVTDIPCDYDGLMGVPVTFMNNYNPEQFEIVASSQTGCHKDSMVLRKYSDYYGFTQDGKSNGRTGATMGNNPIMLGDDGIHVYYENAEGRRVQSIYRRIFIKNKKPEQRRYPDDN